MTLELSQLMEAHARLRADNLVRAVALSSRYGDRTVLQDVDLTIRRGEVFVVMGPSGCGKTTRLRPLCGLLPPSRGAVFVDGIDVYDASADALQQLRRRTGLSFQGGALLGSMSILDNVALPMRENTRLPERVVVETARMKLDMVGLLHAKDLLPSALSGGMRKRAAIARAIALDPEIVYFDEPSAGLDPCTAAEIDNLICKLNQVFGITMVVVTHDLPSAHGIADRIVVLLDGRVAALGSRDEIWNSTDVRIRSFIERRAAGNDGRGVDIAAHMEI